MAETPVSDELLQCGLCLYSLESPRTLTKCFHSFCKECLDGIDQVIQKGVSGWKCPICTAFSSIDEVLSDTFLEKVLKLKDPDAAAKETTICQQCHGDVGVKWKCEDCRIQLCDPCRVSHLNIPLLKSHTITGFVCNRPTCPREVFMDELVFCKTHTDRVVELNCKKCETPLCVLCKVKSHDTHQTETVEDALARIVPNVDQWTENIKEHIQTIEGQVDKLRRDIFEIKESYAEMKVRVHERTDHLVAELKRLESQEDQKLAVEEEKAVGTLEKIKLELEAQLFEMKQLVTASAFTRKYAKRSTLLIRFQTGLRKNINSASDTKLKPGGVTIWLPVFGMMTEKEKNKRLREIWKITTFQIKEIKYF